MKAKVLGFVVAESKKGTIGTSLSLETEFDEYRQETAEKCEGNDCIREYIRGDYSRLLAVGQTVDLVYGKGFQDKAVLREVIPIEEA